MSGHAERALALSLGTWAWIVLVAAAAPVTEPGDPFDVQLRARSNGSGVVLVIGDLKGRPMPEAVTASLRFLVQWHKGDPTVQSVPVIGAPFGRTAVQRLTLGLPISGLRILRQTERSARIQVMTCTLSGLAGVGCPMTLRLVYSSETMAWHVLAVSLP